MGWRLFAADLIDKIAEVLNCSADQKRSWTPRRSAEQTRRPTVSDLADFQIHVGWHNRSDGPAVSKGEL
jgi:hypothetical protein